MFGYIYKKDVAIIAVVLCLCLGVGSFFDYRISSALFNIGSMYGRFVEAAGELPFELTASIAGAMLVRSARPDSKASKWLAALGVLINVGLVGYEIIGSLRVGGKLIAFQLVLTFVLVIAANFIAYRFTRDTEPDELTRWALMVLAVWVAQAIILNVIVKPLWSRPRMRVIEVTPGLNFQPWWVIGNPDKWAYIAAGVIKDGFKSFASGHTAHAAIGLMLAGLPAAAFKEKPSRRRVIFWAAVVVAAFVAFGRIVIGAHFLSDVSCGFALVLALECLAARIAYPDGVQYPRLNHRARARLERIAMLAFNNDYSHGAHPAVLQALVDTNMEPQPGYGTDAHTERAKQLIREACQAPDADVFFLVGGTQANATVIDMLLAPYEGVVAAETGHVACHEAGAIEFGGHKVLTIPGYEGKMHAEDLENYIQVFYENESYEHTVFPGAVYVSLSTEYGTLYSKAELAAIHAVCRKREIPLFVDGARLAYALAADECDITLPELAQLCDVFYIGGTKCGALCGEAVVFCGMHAPAHPIPRIKQHGALLAKGRLTGVQFEALFTDSLYFEIGRQAIETAQALRRVLHERGYQFFLETPTNQQFVILPNEDMARIREHASIEYWEKYDDTHTVVRFCTSWATTQEDIDALAAVL